MIPSQSLLQESRSRAMALSAVLVAGAVALFASSPAEAASTDAQRASICLSMVDQRAQDSGVKARTSVGRIRSRVVNVNVRIDGERYRATCRFEGGELASVDWPAPLQPAVAIQDSDQKPTG